MSYLNKHILLLLLFLSSLKIYGQDIIPKPVEIKLDSISNSFTFNPQTQIIYQDSLLTPVINYFQDYVKEQYHFSLNQHYKPKLTAGESNIYLAYDASLKSPNGAYKLEVKPNHIRISAANNEGLFYGIQSLIQLLHPEKTSYQAIQIPSLSIYDYPRFQYRGMHLDVSRHFFDVPMIKKYIDYLALHKLNYFHWHLTDDQGWRIEIKKYPKLTEIGAWRSGTIIGLFPGKGNEHIKYQVLPDQIKISPANHEIKTDGIKYGGFYTQEEVKEVIKYAAERFITIIPEIEMPAHSMAALAAYPELGTEPHIKKQVATTWGMFNKYNNVFQASESTFSFLEDVLAEVAMLFPSPYIHIGGDEASKVWYKQSKETQAFMQKHQIKTEVELQSYFIRRMEKFLNSKNKTIIGWDEILDGGLAPNAVVMSWRGEKGGISAAQQKHKVIMSPEHILYFNHSQFLKDDSLTVKKISTLENVYAYDPVPSVLSNTEQTYIWGAQANLWTEYISNPKKIEYMLFPRLSALSEITWSPKHSKNFLDFKQRLQTQLKRYRFWGIQYAKIESNL